VASTIAMKVLSRLKPKLSLIKIDTGDRMNLRNRQQVDRMQTIFHQTTQPRIADEGSYGS
jgi:hypothetical protein